MSVVRERLADLYSESMLQRIYTSLKMMIIPFEQFVMCSRILWVVANHYIPATPHR